MRLRNPVATSLSCTSVTGMTVAECMDCARNAASQFRAGWLRAIGAPDYQAYLTRHAATHPDVPPMSERDYAAFFIDRRYAGGGMRCC